MTKFLVVCSAVEVAVGSFHQKLKLNPITTTSLDGVVVIKQKQLSGLLKKKTKKNSLFTIKEIPDELKQQKKEVDKDHEAAIKKSTKNSFLRQMSREIGTTRNRTVMEEIGRSTHDDSTPFRFEEIEGKQGEGKVVVNKAAIEAISELDGYETVAIETLNGEPIENLVDMIHKWFLADRAGQDIKLELAIHKEGEEVQFDLPKPRNYVILHSHIQKEKVVRGERGHIEYVGRNGTYGVSIEKDDDNYVVTGVMHHEIIAVQHSEGEQAAGDLPSDNCLVLSSSGLVDPESDPSSTLLNTISCGVPCSYQSSSRWFYPFTFTVRSKDWRRQVQRYSVLLHRSQFQGIVKELIHSHKYGDYAKCKDSHYIKMLFKKKHANPYERLRIIRRTIQYLLPKIQKQKEESLKFFLEDLKAMSQQPSGEFRFPEEFGFENPDKMMQKGCKVRIDGLKGKHQKLNNQHGIVKKKAKKTGKETKWIVELEKGFDDDVIIVDGCNVQIHGLTNEMQATSKSRAFPDLQDIIARYWTDRDELVTVGFDNSKGNNKRVLVAKFDNGEEKEIGFHSAHCDMKEQKDDWMMIESVDLEYLTNNHKGGYFMQMPNQTDSEKTVTWLAVAPSHEFREDGSPPDEVLWIDYKEGGMIKWTKTIDGARGTVTRSYAMALERRASLAPGEDGLPKYTVQLDKPFERYVKVKKKDIAFGDIKVNLLGKMIAVAAEGRPMEYEDKATETHTKGGPNWGFGFKGNVIGGITKGSWATRYTQMEKYIGWRVVKLNGKEVKNHEELVEVKKQIEEGEEIIFTVQKDKPAPDEFLSMQNWTIKSIGEKDWHDVAEFWHGKDRIKRQLGFAAGIGKHTDDWGANYIFEKVSEDPQVLDEADLARVLSENPQVPDGRVGLVFTLQNDEFKLSEKYLKRVKVSFTLPRKEIKHRQIKIDKVGNIVELKKTAPHDFNGKLDWTIRSIVQAEMSDTNIAIMLLEKNENFSEKGDADLCDLLTTRNISDEAPLTFTMVYDAFQFDAKFLERSLTGYRSATWNTEKPFTFEGSNIVYVTDENCKEDGLNAICQYKTGVIQKFNKEDKMCSIRFCGSENRVSRIHKKYVRPARPPQWNPFWGNISDHISEDQETRYLDKYVSAGHPVGFLEIDVHSFQHFGGTQITIFSRNDQVIPKTATRVHEAIITFKNPDKILTIDHLPPVMLKNAVKNKVIPGVKNLISKEGQAESNEVRRHLESHKVYIPLFNPHDDIIFEIRKGGKKVMSIFEDEPDKDDKKNCAVPLSLVENYKDKDLILSVQMEWMSVRHSNTDDDAIEKKGMTMARSNREWDDRDYIKMKFHHVQGVEPEGGFWQRAKELAEHHEEPTWIYPPLDSDEILDTIERFVGCISELYEGFEYLKSFLYWRNEYTKQPTVKMTSKTWFRLVSFFISPLARSFYFFRVWLYFAMIRDGSCDLYRELDWLVNDQADHDSDEVDDNNMDQLNELVHEIDVRDRHHSNVSEGSFTGSDSPVSSGRSSARRSSTLADGTPTSERGSAGMSLAPGSLAHVGLDHQDGQAEMIDRMKSLDKIEKGSFVHIRRRPVRLYQHIDGAKPALVDWNNFWLNKVGKVIQTETMPGYCRVEPYGIEGPDVHLPEESLERIPTKKRTIVAKCPPSRDWGMSSGVVIEAMKPNGWAEHNIGKEFLGWRVIGMAPVDNSEHQDHLPLIRTDEDLKSAKDGSRKSSVKTVRFEVQEQVSIPKSSEIHYPSTDSKSYRNSRRRASSFDAIMSSGRLTRPSAPSLPSFRASFSRPSESSRGSFSFASESSTHAAITTEEEDTSMIDNPVEHFEDSKLEMSTKAHNGVVIGDPFQLHDVWNLLVMLDDGNFIACRPDVLAKREVFESRDGIPNDFQLGLKARAKDKYFIVEEIEDNSWASTNIDTKYIGWRILKLDWMLIVGKKDFESALQLITMLEPDHVPTFTFEEQDIQGSRNRYAAWIDWGLRQMGDYDNVEDPMKLQLVLWVARLIPDTVDSIKDSLSHLNAT